MNFKKLVIAIILIPIAINGYTQENVEIGPLEWKTTFVINQLQVKDTTFIIGLKELLFQDYKDYFDKTTMHKSFDMSIDKIDSINYRLNITYDKKPLRDHFCGYYMDDDIFILISGNRDLFIPLRRKKKYSYIVLIAPFDPPCWEIEYNIRNGSFKCIRHIARW
jgi:hypothetical protein